MTQAVAAHSFTCTDQIWETRLLACCCVCFNDCRVFRALDLTGGAGGANKITAAQARAAEELGSLCPRPGGALFPSVIHEPIHSFSDSFVHSFSSQPVIDALAQSFSHSFAHSFIRSFTYPVSP